jgi:hypothetical protein
MNSTGAWDKLKMEVNKENVLPNRIESMISSLSLSSLIRKHLKMKIVKNDFSEMDPKRLSLSGAAGLQVRDHEAPERGYPYRHQRLKRGSGKIWENHLGSEIRWMSSLWITTGTPWTCRRC